MKEEAYYWPLWTSYLLSPREQSKIKKMIRRLQRAQTHLWRALNIYDDFYDGEGIKSELPQANSYYHKYLETYYSLNLPKKYYQLFNKTFANLNKANRDEILQPKIKISNDNIIISKFLPNPKPLIRLCDKSLALALGPIALLAILKYKMDGIKIKSLLNFFKCALSAKQLSDDSHDWLEDLNTGLVTSANLPILKAIKKRHLKISIGKSSTMANLLFAQESSPQIIANLESLCGQARREMNKINTNQNNLLLTRLIKPLENACREAKNFQLLISH